MTLKVAKCLECEVQGDKLRFSIDGLTTNWMAKDDLFIKRIDEENLNEELKSRHLAKEIEIKNILDEGISFYESGKYPHSIKDFDRVLFYDSQYAEALLYKSYALRSQKHFVKSLRYYKRAVKADATLKDSEYHRMLLGEANNERDNFPKLKSNIYAGDEYFARGEFLKAVESYNRALVNPSKFRDRILSKLLNKKATALLKLNQYEEALDCFKSSAGIDMNDYAIFGEGYCEYKLDLDVCEGFKDCLNISKSQMLKQARILNFLGYYHQSLRISDYLSQNHFRMDDFYLMLKDTRSFSMEKLGID